MIELWAENASYCRSREMKLNLDLEEEEDPITRDECNPRSGTQIWSGLERWKKKQERNAL